MKVRLYRNCHPITKTSNFTTDLLNNTNSVAVEENENELPFGWETRISENGSEFYIDHNTHSTQWERPNPLPPGWQARRDVNSNRIYFVNSERNGLSWQRPTELIVIEHQQQMNIWNERRRENRSNFDRRYLYVGSGKNEASYFFIIRSL
ncbi:hypothetical protein MXB_4551 [Myxobolus squamalis]|nr:hypothetical protein MXB_4551 [Myxobolus squamalis]